MSKMNFNREKKLAVYWVFGLTLLAWCSLCSGCTGIGQH